MKVYDSVHYAETRLVNTVVLVKRKPVYVKRINRDRTVRVVAAVRGKGRERSYLVKLDDLIVFDLRLGFVNYDGSARYLSRRTLRNDWRQGLRENNVRASMGGVDSDLIGRALLHRYPCFKAAVELVSSQGHHSAAWCEDFAVSSYPLTVMWRKDAIGTISEDTITLSNKYRFLRKQLKESINECYAVV